MSILSSQDSYVEFHCCGSPQYKAIIITVKREDYNVIVCSKAGYRRPNTTKDLKRSQQKVAYTAEVIRVHGLCYSVQ